MHGLQATARLAFKSHHVIGVDLLLSTAWMSVTRHVTNDHNTSV